MIDDAVVKGHILLVASIQICVLFLGLMLPDVSFFRYKKISRYVFALMYGLMAVILYYVYSFSFLSKHYNSIILPYQGVLGYATYIHDTADLFEINIVLIYSLLYLVPLLILICFIRYTKHVYESFLGLKSRVFNIGFNQPDFLTRSVVILVLVLFGMGAGVVLTRNSFLSAVLRNKEEPIISFLFSGGDRRQGLYSNPDQGFIERRAYQKSSDFDKKNVILIIVDALRSDHLSLFGYERKTSPFLDSLHMAGNLKKIELSLSTAASSFEAINSVLRSKIWAHIGFNDFSIQQLLKNQGYKINFILAGDHTNFYDLKSYYGIGSDIDYYMDGFDAEYDYHKTDDRIILEEINNIQQFDSQPNLFYFHLMSAHHAGIRVEKFKTFEPSNREMEVEVYTNFYDNGIIQVDQYIKTIFEKLSAKGYLDNSIIIVTADHGEALGERGEFGHVKSIHTDQLLIPILIWDSDPIDLVKTEYATSVDIAPTIIDRLGLPLPDSWEGKSLIGHDVNKYSFHQLGNDYAVIHKGDGFLMKYIFNRATQEEQLYELISDLYETSNLIDSMDEQYILELKRQIEFFGFDPFHR